MNCKTYLLQIKKRLIVGQFTGTLDQNVTRYSVDHRQDELLAGWGLDCQGNIQPHLHTFDVQGAASPLHKP